MTTDEDTSWLNALAGRSSSPPSSADDAEPALALEARALRVFIRSQESPLASALPSVDAARERELIERARSEGLLLRQAAPSVAAGSTAPRRGWLTDTRVTFAVAAMLLAVIGVGLWRSTLPPAETLRGVTNGTVHLEARDPPALKRQLTRELRAVGIQVSGYERLGHSGIDADLPQPVSPPVAQILGRHHIPIPVDGVLVVEFDAPSRQ